MKSLLRFIGCSALLFPQTVIGKTLSDYGFNCTGFLFCGQSDAPLVLLNRIVGFVATFIGAVAIVAFAYGGIRMIISRGGEGKETGKKAMINAALGLALALMVTGIFNFITYVVMSIGNGGTPL